MTRTVPDRQRRTGPATERAGPADAITRVLSRQVKTGHEQAFEAVLRGLAAEVSCQPGHLDATVLKPPPGRPAQLHDRVLSCPLPGRRRVAFQQDPGPAGRRSKGALRGCPQAQHLSGLEGRLAAPGALVSPSCRVSLAPLGYGCLGGAGGGEDDLGDGIQRYRGGVDHQVV